MLKGISPFLSPELLAILCRMGHGDELVLGDFPGKGGASEAGRWLRAVVQGKSGQLPRLVVVAGAERDESSREIAAALAGAFAEDGADVRLAGELPYWAVNLHGLKPKDRISIGSRVFMVLPDISDSDEIGLAVEVEA